MVGVLRLQRTDQSFKLTETTQILQAGMFQKKRPTARAIRTLLGASRAPQECKRSGNTCDERVQRILDGEVHSARSRVQYRRLWIVPYA